MARKGNGIELQRVEVELRRFAMIWNGDDSHGNGMENHRTEKRGCRGANVRSCKLGKKGNGMKKKATRALVIAAICAMCAMFLGGCAALNSCTKSFSAYADYLDRKVTVYHPYTGDIIFEHEGDMLVSSDDIGIQITTRDGYRYNVGNCTYVIEERG